MLFIAPLLLLMTASAAGVIQLLSMLDANLEPVADDVLIRGVIDLIASWRSFL